MKSINTSQNLKNGDILLKLEVFTQYFYLKKKIFLCIVTNCNLFNQYD